MYPSLLLRSPRLCLGADPGALVPPGEAGGKFREGFGEGGVQLRELRLLLLLLLSPRCSAGGLLQAAIWIQR